MAKLIISVDGQDLRHVDLSRQRMTIGRRADADIPLDDLAVSSEHARITTILDDSFLEDLDSTTGTAVNGSTVKKHVLCDGDVVVIGRYSLRYAAVDQCSDVQRGDGPLWDGAVAASEVERASAKTEPERPASDPAGGWPTISVLNGGQAGSQVSLTKPLTTFGKPGFQVAAIAREDEHYRLRHVEGEPLTAVNGVSVAAGGYVLEEGDVIELAGAKLRFSRLTPS